MSQDAPKGDSKRHDEKRGNVKTHTTTQNTVRFTDLCAEDKQKLANLINQLTETNTINKQLINTINKLKEESATLTKEVASLQEKLQRALHYLAMYQERYHMSIEHTAAIMLQQSTLQHQNLPQTPLVNMENTGITKLQPMPPTAVSTIPPQNFLPPNPVTHHLVPQNYATAKYPLTHGQPLQENQPTQNYNYLSFQLQPQVDNHPNAVQPLAQSFPPPKYTAPQQNQPLIDNQPLAINTPSHTPANPVSSNGFPVTSTQQYTSPNQQLFSDSHLASNPPMHSQSQFPGQHNQTISPQPNNPPASHYHPTADIQTQPPSQPPPSENTHNQNIAPPLLPQNSNLQSQPPHHNPLPSNSATNKFDLDDSLLSFIEDLDIHSNSMRHSHKPQTTVTQSNPKSIAITTKPSAQPQKLLPQQNAMRAKLRQPSEDEKKLLAVADLLNNLPNRQ